MTSTYRDLQPLSAEIVEAQLEELLDPVLSFRRTAQEPAKALAKFARRDQQFVLNWLRIITKTSSEIGYQFIIHAPRALKLMDLDTMDKWILHGMDIYDQNGLYPGSEAFANVEEFLSYLEQQTVSTNLEEIEGVLSRYIQGLSGRPLQIAENNDNEWFTDTETIWLPRQIHRYLDKQDNFTLYKVIAALLWAQIHHGTFRRAAPESNWLSEQLDLYPEPSRAKQIFNILETYRLEACIARQLPGLTREMLTLTNSQEKNSFTPSWDKAIKVVERKESSVEDTVNQLAVLYRTEEVPPIKPWQGVLHPEKAEETSRKRISRESLEAQQWAASLAEKSMSGNPLTIIEQSKTENKKSKDRDSWAIQSGEKPIITPARITNIIESALLDFETIPPDYLMIKREGDLYHSDKTQTSPEGSAGDARDQESGYYYDEWDFQRRNYRKNWCFLKEIDMQSSQEPIVEQTLKKYSGLVLEIRRTFEAIRGSNRRLRRQTSGDEIDIEAVVEAQTEAQTGQELSDRLFTNSRRLNRDTAVMFMVDVSGSTKGWINDAERESLVLLCEAVEILGDQYAIYAFSGMTRKRCELYRIKRFDDAYGEEVKNRIAGIQPKDYTRMGVIIRHLTKLLGQVEARTRLLITLSDGKPDDYDGYRGEYGIEDTRQALIEARRTGINPFCITIDRAARDYLPHMYGESGYTVVSEVQKLPKRVSEIYRRLTT
jgi:nitric oxide reductase NorD protein